MDSDSLNSTELSLNLALLEDSASFGRRSPPLGISDEVRAGARLKIGGGPRLGQGADEMGLVDLSDPSSRPPLRDPFALLSNASRLKADKPKLTVPKWEEYKKNLMGRVKADREKGLEERKRMWNEEHEKDGTDSEKEEEEEDEEEDEGSDLDLDDPQDPTAASPPPNQSEETDSGKVSEGVNENGNETVGTEGELDLRLSTELSNSLPSSSGEADGAGNNGSHHNSGPTNFMALIDSDCDDNKENIPLKTPSDVGRSSPLPGIESRSSLEDSLPSRTPSPERDTQPPPQMDAWDLPDTLSQFSADEPDLLEISTLQK